LVKKSFASQLHLQKNGMKPDWGIRKKGLIALTGELKKSYFRLFTKLLVNFN
jgi:hypothetical protein